MIRKAILFLALAGALLMICDSSAEAPVETKKAVKEAPLTHVVIFQLKKDSGADAIESIITDSHEMLTKIPTVRGLKVGRPSEKSKGGPVVQDYQVGLLVMFDDYDGLKTYNDHEQHKNYVKKHGKDFDKVLVYDFVDQAK
jgi:hypothetical protein